MVLRTQLINPVSQRWWHISLKGCAASRDGSQVAPQDCCSSAASRLLSASLDSGREHVGPLSVGTVLAERMLGSGERVGVTLGKLLLWLSHPLSFLEDKAGR